MVFSSPFLTICLHLYVNRLIPNLKTFAVWAQLIKSAVTRGNLSSCNMQRNDVSSCRLQNKSISMKLAISVFYRNLQYLFSTETCNICFLQKPAISVFYRTLQYLFSTETYSICFLQKPVISVFYRNLQYLWPISTEICNICFLQMCNIFFTQICVPSYRE